MNVRIRLFARARDLAGAEFVTVPIRAGATVGNLRQELAVAYPTLAALLTRCAFAVNGEFAEDALSVPSGGEIVVLPPVSGGARP